MAYSLIGEANKKALSVNMCDKLQENNSDVTASHQNLKERGGDSGQKGEGNEQKQCSI